MEVECVLQTIGLAPVGTRERGMGEGKEGEGGWIR